MTATPAPRAGIRSQALPLLVAGCFFMENLDATIVTTAVPSIARDLGVSAASVGVTITAYVMTVAVLIPLSGWLADRFGTRRVLLVALALFTIASAACALSPALSVLVAARIVQGVGGALMVPVGRMTVLRMTEKKDLVRAIAVLTWPALAAPIIAPLVGGVLTTYLSWHWIFLINLPLGVIGFLAGVRILPKRDTDAAAGRSAAPDWVGLSLTSLGIASLVWAITLVTATRVELLPTVVFGVVGLTLLGLAIRHVLRTPRPFVDLRLLRIRTYGVSVGGGSVYRLAISAIPFVLPLLFQRAFHWTPVEAGAALLFLFAGNLGIKPTTTWMLNTAGFKRVMIASHLVGALCLLTMIFFRETTPFGVILVVLLISGAARSTGFTAYNTITYADIEAAHMTGANVLDATVQQLAVGFGVALGAVSITAGLLLAPGADATSPIAYDAAFATLAVVLLLAAIPAWRLPASAGGALVGRPAVSR
ncbi:MAG: MFS transporter [Actinomycetota bacterium]|nr:MFS transporter [Actinomycetota bacterium]